MIYYLAGAIDYETDKGMDWRKEIKELCRGSNNISFFNPVLPYDFNNLTDDMSTYIHDVNMTALNRADVIVVRIMEGQSSIGTPIEMYSAMSNNKPIILITNMEKSVYIKHMSKNAKVIKSLVEAYNYILDLENSK